MPGRRNATVVIVAGCLIAVVTYGLRTSFGLFTDPLSDLRGWDRETFLSQTCAKAGLPHDCWRSGARVYRFAADVFGD